MNNVHIVIFCNDFFKDIINVPITWGTIYGSLILVNILNLWESLMFASYISDIEHSSFNKGEQCPYSYFFATMFLKILLMYQLHEGPYMARILVNILNLWESLMFASYISDIEHSSFNKGE